MMDITEKLVGLDKSSMIEVAYLVGRFLSHRMTETNFHDHIMADVMTPYGKKSNTVALSIIHEIEVLENTKVAELTMSQRAFYLELLRKFVTNASEKKIDLNILKAAAEALRGFSQ